MFDREPAADAVTKRQRTVRDTDDEAVYVTWFVRADAASGGFVTIEAVDDEGTLRVLSPDTNELGQLLRALETALNDSQTGREVVRDLGLERVYVEWEGRFVTLAVEEMGDLSRMLVLDTDEAAELRDAVEAAKDEVPSPEAGPHV
jgi:hypothetical protein